MGTTYPYQAMQVEASIWDASLWAGPVDWSQAPFVSKYSNFQVYGCEASGGDIQPCGSGGYSWNAYTQLTPAERSQMMEYRDRYMTYDYCAQASTRKPDCDFNHAKKTS
ncbi:hypothetical protein M569_06553 [Genlisea aurea]|uniref:Xyloglucan endo-transglycosylase C-terminal domain-containing protein n=1 Tax=Genlisea aurea TaxID=192259 RepID=S8CNB9_9LAMI|nr:hypothetical protein M569_06553 [Genlisea aurea]